MPRRLLVLLGVAALASTAGCGGGDDSGSGASSTKPRTATFGGPDSGRPVAPVKPGAMR
jgi:hypothetical protein